MKITKFNITQRNSIYFQEIFSNDSPTLVFDFLNMDPKTLFFRLKKCVEVTSFWLFGFSKMFRDTENASVAQGINHCPIITLL